MNIINSIKKLWFGATDKDIETAELGARIDVLMAKHGVADSPKLAPQEASIRERLDALMANQSGLTASQFADSDLMQKYATIDSNDHSFVNPNWLYEKNNYNPLEPLFNDMAFHETLDDSHFPFIVTPSSSPIEVNPSRLMLSDDGTEIL